MLCAKSLSAQIALTTNQSAEVRLQRIKGFGWLGFKDARRAVPALVYCLQDTNEEVAVRAARTLSVAELEPPIVVPALTKCLQDKRVRVRTTAIQGLGYFHAGARSAVPALVGLLRDTDPLIRELAADALEVIEPGAVEKAVQR